MLRTLRAVPTLLRIGFAEAVAYRAEFVVWLLATNMPLVMLALWTAVARDGPVGRYGQAEFTAYFLAALVVARRSPRHQISLFFSRVMSSVTAWRAEIPS